MPTYTYKCSKCDSELDIFHSMSDVAKDCSVCGSEGTLVKKVAKVVRVVRAPGTSSKKPGSIVRQYIEDVKEEVKEEKSRLRNQDYEQ